MSRVIDCLTVLFVLVLVHGTLSYRLLKRDVIANADQDRGGDEVLFSLVPVNTAKLVNEQLFEGDIAGIDQDGLTPDAAATMQQNALRDPKFRWPNGVVPYTIASDYSGFMRRQIMDAMRMFSNKTPCIKFVPRNTETDYLSIEANAGCFSFVGRAGGKQVVSLSRIGCLDAPGVIQHELMHSLGFFHEQSRTDRDDYLDINWDNIRKDNHKQFTKYSNDKITGFGQPYDFGSVMHYGMYDFAMDQDLYAIKPKDQYKGTELGQRRGLSKIDVAKIKIMYRCDPLSNDAVSTTTTTTTTTTQAPGFTADCQVVHTARKGDTIGWIVKELEVSLDTLKRLNPGRTNFDSISEGEKICVV